MRSKKTTQRALNRAVGVGLKEANDEFLRLSKKLIGEAKSARFPKDFSCAIGTYRAWPDGHVTRLDEDGDSIKTVISVPPTKITIDAPAPLAERLRRKLETGLYGKNLEEVAERILCEFLR